jgi:hypothetical protein
MDVQKTQKKYFSIHSVKALKNKQFSIFRANIENTIEKLELAKNMFPSNDWYIEFHNYKISLNPVII